MKSNLQDIYFDVLDRIHLNENSGSNSKKTQEQIKKDYELKEKIETVFENPSLYDVYYQKHTLQLRIEIMPEEAGMKKDLFNRIEIQY